MTIQAFATKIVPVNCPNLWLGINIVIVIWSFLLIVSIFLEDTRLDRLQDTHAYLCWNFGTTFLWFVEVGLTAWDHKRNHQPWEWTQTIELVAGIYLVGDSIRMFSKWVRPDQDVESELFDCILNLVFYSFESWSIVYHVDEKEHNHPESATTASTLNNDGYETIA